MHEWVCDGVCVCCVCARVQSATLSTCDLNPLEVANQYELDEYWQALIKDCHFFSSKLETEKWGTRHCV